MYDNHNLFCASLSHFPTVSQILIIITTRSPLIDSWFLPDNRILMGQTIFPSPRTTLFLRVYFTVWNVFIPTSEMEKKLEIRVRGPVRDSALHTSIAYGAAFDAETFHLTVKASLRFLIRSP